MNVMIWKGPINDSVGYWPGYSGPSKKQYEGQDDIKVTWTMRWDEKDSMHKIKCHIFFKWESNRWSQYINRNDAM